MEKIEKENIERKEPVVEKPEETALPTPQPLPELAEFPGQPIKQPIILWVGAGDLFRRVEEAGTFNYLLEIHNAYLTIVDIHSPDKIEAYQRLQNHPKSSNVRYYDVSQAKQRENLVYNRFGEKKQPFTHVYIATWPATHLLSAVKYSTLCHGGDIIITKPLDLNVPMVKNIKEGAFPGLTDKLTVDGHYRNKGYIRELHRLLPSIILDPVHKQPYGKLRGFRMWLVEETTIEDENRLQALECGVIWDLATHLISLIQLFLLDEPYLALYGYTKGDSEKIRNVKLEIKNALRKRYIGCELREQNVETLAVIEVTVTFEFEVYGHHWESKTIHGILVVGKAASRGGRNVIGPVKQIDFEFEKGPINLNYNTGVLMPAILGYNPQKEDGFFQPVIELLTHTQRPVRREETGSGITPTDPGKYHCGISFEEAFQNVELINKIKNHPFGLNLLPSYDKGIDIHDLMNHLISLDYLEKGWMIDGNYGKFI